MTKIMTKEVRLQCIEKGWIEVHEERNNDSLIELLLSIVHDEYKPIQNDEAFDFMDQIEYENVW